MNKAFIISLSVLLGSVALTSGCNYASKPFTILYQKPAVSSGDMAVTPSDSKTNVTGTAPSGSGDVTIAPAAGDSGISGFTSTPAPTPETAPTSETPPSPPLTVVEGDGVADDSPEVGTPPSLPAPVSCDAKAFAFVSNRNGRSDILVQQDGDLRTLGHADSFTSHMTNLTWQPGTKNYAADNSLATGDGAFGLNNIVFGTRDDSSLRPIDVTDAFTRSPSWNATGTKFAYISYTGFDGDLLTEIHVRGTDTSTGTDVVVVSNRDDLSLPIDHLVWAGDELIYSAQREGAAATLHVVHWNRMGVAGSLDLSAQEGSDDFGRAIWVAAQGAEPAASRDGSKIAYVEDQGHSGRQILICRLTAGDFSTSTTDPKNKCRDLTPLTSAGNNTQPSFSPDGRWIYFVSDRDGNKEIYRIRADGTEEERITNDPSEDTSPAPFAPSASCE